MHILIIIKEGINFRGSKEEIMKELKGRHGRVREIIFQLKVLIKKKKIACKRKEGNVSRWFDITHCVFRHH